ncbi:MAG: hypothetical protein IIY21_24530 [Clostridiales bacterium]|nr:hypothetical protein [Clostridiales bacterium]
MACAFTARIKLNQENFIVSNVQKKWQRELGVITRNTPKKRTSGHETDTAD